MAAPSITLISPTSGHVGTLVTITGTDLGSVTSLKFGGASGVSATPVSNTATSITVKVPATAATGVIYVATAGGNDSTDSPFFVTAPLSAAYSQTAPGFGATPILATEGFTNYTFEVRTDPWINLTATQVERNRELAHIKFNPPVDGTPYQN